MTGPAWVPCSGECENPWCLIHDMHAFECACPAIEDWPAGVDPYLNGGRMNDTQLRALLAALNEPNPKETD